MKKRTGFTIFFVIFILLVCTVTGCSKSSFQAKDSTLKETSSATEEKPDVPEKPLLNGKIVVLDPGHGKSTSLMSDEEKLASGLVQNAKGNWGEWRHYKTGSSTIDCEGDGCNKRVTPTGDCWYPCTDGDRNIEPELNLNNALSAKKHLEEKGYTVRLTRTSNDEYLSMSDKLAFCHPNNDRNVEPDADIFICLHSNAANGSASGTAYISLDGEYDQKWISDTYVEDSNTLGKLCNEYIAKNSSLEIWGDGVIGNLPELIAFCKSPVPCGYLEIGYYDNPAELEILQNETDLIGKGIAEGIDAYFKTIEN